MNAQRIIHENSFSAIQKTPHHGEAIPWVQQHGFQITQWPQGTLSASRWILKLVGAADDPMM